MTVVGLGTVLVPSMLSSQQMMGCPCKYFLTNSLDPLGITTDLLVYAIVIPVLPFYLESLNYTGVSRLVGYLQFAFVSVRVYLFVSSQTLIYM